jgi:RND family efflux transporter MFP subunit
MEYEKMKSTAMYLVRGLVIGAMAIFLTACGQESETVTEEVARPVKMLEIGGGGAVEVLEYPGEVAPLQDAEMAFEVAGKIIGFPVDEGQEVKKGDILARLDPRDFQANLDAMFSREKTAKATYKRNESIHKEGVISDQQLDVVLKNYEVARADADIARKAMDDAILRAPFSGKVAKKIKADFKNVKAKEPVLILQDVSHLEIVVNLPESDAVRIRPGLTLEERRERVKLIKPVAFITSIPDRAFPLGLKELSTTADPVTRTFEATFTFDAPDDITVLPGMTAKVQIPLTEELDTSGGLSIPSSAVRTDESGKAFVWVVDTSSMKVRKMPVELGELSGSSVTALKGLNRGDTIAISGVHNLREEMPVRRLEQ